MRATFIALFVYALLSAAAPGAQTNPGGTAFPNQFPDPLSYRPPVPQAPDLQIVSARQIELPGPLLSGPRLVDGVLEVLTASGLARIPWDGEFKHLTIDDGPQPSPQPDDGVGWAVSLDGTHRAGAVGPGILTVQRSCHRCATGWRRRWRLRAAGLAQVAPLITERRVYFGAADNQVYGVRRKNGHRAWVTALEGRVVRPLSLWVDAVNAIAALLVIPEPGRELVVLDASGGRAAFHYRPQQDGDRFVGSALSAPGGRVVLARQGYRPGDAGLVVLEIAVLEPEIEEPGDSEPTGYNRAHFPAAGLM